jgi:dTMP kinase
MSDRGKFITLEGVDGAGKSTHAEFIADALRTKAAHVIATREPGGTDLAERLREAILSQDMAPGVETLLLFAARADHVAKVIRPALEAGNWVVCDRFSDATAAYQGAGKGVDAGLIERLRQLAHPGLEPDRTFVFDCPYDVAAKRLTGANRPLDRFEREDRDFFERVRNAYLEHARAQPNRMRVIDASTDMATIRKAITAELSDL